MLEATASACAAAARPSETNPRQATRVMRCLTTPRELWSSSFTLRRASRGGRRVAGTGRSCGSPIEEPSVRAPRRAALSSAHRESSTSADALLTTSATPRCCVRRWARPTSRSRQGPRLGALPRRLPSPDACSTRRLRAWSRTRTRHRPQGFATLDRLPTLFRRPDPTFEGFGRLDHRFPGAHHALARLTTRRPSTSAIESIRKHDRRTCDTRPGCGHSACAARATFPVGPRISPRPSPCYRGSAETAESSFLGSGAFRWSRARARFQAPSRRDGSRERLCPNPIDSDTPRRASTHGQAGGA